MIINRPRTAEEFINGMPFFNHDADEDRPTNPTRKPIQYTAQARAAIEKARRIAAARKVPLYTGEAGTVLDYVIRRMQID